MFPRVSADPERRVALKKSAERLQKDKNAADLTKNAASDPRFAALRAGPEFQKLVGPAPAPPK